MDEDQLFTDEEIRDTATHDSIKADTGEFTAETITIVNGLDQQVTLQLQGSRDNTKWFDIGAPFNVEATTDDYETVSDYFPNYRVTAKCSTAPTTGDLSVWVLKSKGG